MALCAACGIEFARPFRFCPECGAPVEPPPRSQRKTVTVVFCDLVGSTALGESADPEAVREVLTRYFEQMRTIVERHGGTVQKFIGDAVVAVFGVPAVHADDALRAARAASEMRTALPALAVEARIGVNTGEVVTSGDDTLVTGDAVNVAARLEQAAASGEILIGRLTRELAGNALSVEELEPLALKGKRDRVPAYRLVTVAGPAGRGAGSLLLPRDEAPFVGRERELAWLRELADRAVAGEGTRRVTIVGEAGLGKSRLCREFVAGLTADAAVLVGRCPPYGEGITFWPVRELLHQANRRELQLGQSSNEVFGEVRHVLEELAAARPVVVVFDDLQWAEPTFLDLVEYLAARLGRVRVLILCLARPQFAEQRPSWLAPDADALDLGPLSDEESSRLLERLGAPAAVRTRIAEAAEGNPLFVEQLAAVADELGPAFAMPGTIRGVLHERLDRLEGDERAGA